MPPLDPLPPVPAAAVELLRIPMRLEIPLRSARGERSERDVLLVHVIAADVEGWAECPVEPDAGYSTETTASTVPVLRDQLLPHVGTTAERLPEPHEALERGARRPLEDAAWLRDVLLRAGAPPMAAAALELAVLDAQLRREGRSLASWLGATARQVAPGAALGLHRHLDGLLAEADAALLAGAARLRVKIVPGQAAAPLQAVRDHVGPDVLLQADANGSFGEDDPELDRLDGVGLACLEQPLAADDLAGHARLAARLATPICLDEPLTSVAAIDAAIAAGACEVVCLKPSRVGWRAAREAYDRCAERGVPVWIGGMLDTAIGRTANLAVAALPHLALPPDLDPRGRFAPDLADPRLPVDGLVPVPAGPGTDAAPSDDALARAEVVGTWTP